MPGPGAGTLDRKVVFRRRAQTGVTLGAYADYGSAVWGNFRQVAEQDDRIGSLAYTAKIGVLMIRDSAWARGLTAADRAVIDGEEYELRAISLPDRSTGMIRIDVRGGPSRQAYADMISRRGETVTIRRPGSPNVDVSVRALVSDYATAELVGGVMQAWRDVAVLAKDLTDGGFPVPPRRNDKIIFRGRTVNIEGVDDSTHLSAGDLNVYALKTLGPA